MTPHMTHDQAMLKLLAIEPECREVLEHVTGWPKAETHASLQRLLHQGAITYWNGNYRQWFRVVL